MTRFTLRDVQQSRAIDSVLMLCVLRLMQEASPDEKSLQDLGAAATAVTKALNDLLQHIKKGTGDREVGVAFSLISF